MEPNSFAHPDAIQQGLLLPNSSENKTEDLHEEEMEAKYIPADGILHQQIVCNNEKTEEAADLAMAMTLDSPNHSSAEDIFSDTMELASYLHRRVQEIGKQFRHRPFRINTSEKLESLQGFLQGLSCDSQLCLGSPTAKSCKPGERAILRENTESFLQETAPSPPEEKPSSVSFFSNRDLSVCAKMTEHKSFNLYDNGFGGGKAFNTEMEGYDSRPNEGNKEEALVLPLTHREENFSSGNVCDSAHLSKRKRVDAPSKYGEGNLPILSENASVSKCREQGFHIQELVMWNKSPKHVSDVNLTSFQGCENLNMCLDAASCPVLGCTEGKNPRSQCSTPSHNSSPHLLYQASSHMNITEHLSLDLKLPSPQDYAISDAEDAGVLPRLQIAERDFEHPEHSSSCTVGSHMPCHAGLQENPVLPESVRKQGSVHTQITHSQTGAENSSSLHSNIRHSMSSVDSSECDNCGADADKGGSVTTRVGLTNSNEADGNKFEEIDAMSEAMHLDTHRQEDKDGTKVALGEPKNDSLDLLLDAIQVTSGECLVAKEDADACQPSSSHPQKHVPQRNGDKSPEERKQFSLVKMFQKVSDCACLPERINGSMHPGSNSSHRIQDKMHSSSSALLSDTLSLHLGSFPIVRKRSNRCRKTFITKGSSPGRKLASPAVRFKSLQAVSEVNLPNSRKSGKKLAANKQDGKKLERGKISDSSQSCLNSRRERTWEKQQDSLGKEDCYSMQEKREKFTDGDKYKEQLPAMPAPEGDEEEQGMLSRRARLQILPTKFSDSVLQPWKKGDRRRS